jgi:hypothetical protein
MLDLTHGEENSKDGTEISRRSVLVGGAAMVAVAALPAATFAAGTKAATSTDGRLEADSLLGRRHGHETQYRALRSGA